MCSLSPAKLSKLFKQVFWAYVCPCNCPLKNCSVRGELEAWQVTVDLESTASFWNLDNECTNSDCLDLKGASRLIGSKNR